MKVFATFAHRCIVFVGLAGVATTGLSILSGTPVQAGVSKDPGDVPTNELWPDLEAFDSVGRISAGNGWGSGTYIGNRWVLTAAHVVAPASDPTFELGDQEFEAEGWAWPQNYNFPTADIALMRLESDVTSEAAADLYTAGNAVGKKGHHVGFGVKGSSGEQGITNISGENSRGGTNMLDTLWGDFVTDSDDNRIVMSDFDSGDPSHNYMGSAEPTDLEYLIAGGDSGGSVFIETENGFKSAAVTILGLSRDGTNNTDFGDMSGATRVSSYDNWLEDVQATVEETGSFDSLADEDIADFAVPAMASGNANIQRGDLRRYYSYDEESGEMQRIATPEPSSVALLGLGGLALMGRRRRK
jgi:secreted trypsin-like serine protease